MNNVLRCADKEKRKSMMKEGPHGLVRFQVYSDKEKLLLTTNDRRKNRVKIKMSKYPPLDMWAHWVVESILYFMYLMTRTKTTSIWKFQK